MKMVKERKDSMMGSTVMGTQCVRDGGGGQAVGHQGKTPVELLWAKLLGTGVYKSFCVLGLLLLSVRRNGWDI